MALFLNDTFTDTSGVVLDAHTGETGATWTRHGSSPATVRALISDANRARADLNGGTAGARPIYYASGTPGSADYEVTVNVRVVTAIRELHFGARFSTAAETGYYVRVRPSNSDLTLQTATAGTIANLSLVAFTWSAATSYVVKLTMSGTTLKVYVDDVEKISVTDSSFSTAGVVVVAPDCFGNITNTAGPHIDSITAGTGGQTINLGLITGTGTVNAMGKAKTRALAQVTETGSVFALAGSKTKQIGLVTETGEPFPLGASKTRALGNITETGTPFPLVGSKTRPLGLVAETGTVFALTEAKSRTLGLVTETSTGFPLGKTKARTLGLVSGTGTLFAITVSGGSVPASVGTVTVRDGALVTLIISDRSRVALATADQPRATLETADRPGS